MRLDDLIAAEVDRVAFAAGMSRSAWITNAIARSLLATDREALPVVRDGEAGGEEGPATAKGLSIQLRLSSREGTAIAAVAAEHGLSRMEWIRRLIRWQLWDKAGELRLGRNVSNDIEGLIRQVRAIGVNLNQAVHAMNAANQADSRLDIARIAADVVAMEERMRRELTGVIRQLQRIVSGNVRYWTQQRPQTLKELGIVGEADGNVARSAELDA